MNFAAVIAGARHAMAITVAFQIESRIVQLRRSIRAGCIEIREKLRRLYSEIQLPAISSVHAGVARSTTSGQQTAMLGGGVDKTRQQHDGFGLRSPARIRHAALFHGASALLLVPLNAH